MSSTHPVGFVKGTARALGWIWNLLFALSLGGMAWLAHKFGIAWDAIWVLGAWLALAAAVAWLVRRGSFKLAVAMALLARLGVFLLTRGAIPTSPDAQFYDSLARSLANGHELPYVIDKVTFLAHAPRLYSYLLSAVFFATSGSLTGPLILNAMLDTATAAILYLAGRNMGAPREDAALSAAAYLIWPHVLLNSAFAQKESLACLLVATATFLQFRSWRERKANGIPYGIVLGLLAMTQPAFFLLAAGFQLVLFARLPARTAIRAILVSSASCAITIAPWIIRNWWFLGDFVPLTTGAGMSTYINAAGSYAFPDQFNGLPEKAWSDQMMAAGMQIIASNPLGYALHELKMMALAFGLEHGPYMVWSTISPPPALRPEATLLATQSGLILLWGLACIISLKGRRSDFFTLLFAMAFAYTATVSIWFEFGARHRAYLLPMVLLWASASFVPRQNARHQSPTTNSE